MAGIELDNKIKQDSDNKGRTLQQYINDMSRWVVGGFTEGVTQNAPGDNDKGKIIIDGPPNITSDQIARIAVKIRSDLKNPTKEKVAEQLADILTTPKKLETALKDADSILYKMIANDRDNRTRHPTHNRTVEQYIDNVSKWVAGEYPPRGEKQNAPGNGDNASVSEKIGNKTVTVTSKEMAKAAALIRDVLTTSKHTPTGEEIAEKFKDLIKDSKTVEQLKKKLENPFSKADAREYDPSKGINDVQVPQTRVELGQAAETARYS